MVTFSASGSRDQILKSTTAEEIAGIAPPTVIASSTEVVRRAQLRNPSRPIAETATTYPTRKNTVGPISCNPSNRNAALESAT